MRGGGFSIWTALPRRALAVMTAVVLAGAWQAGALAHASVPAGSRVAGAQSASCDEFLSDLVHNCGFELGSVGGWTLRRAASGSDVSVASGAGARSGKYALALGAEKGNGTGSQDDSVSQIMRTTAGQIYELSFWMANPMADPAEEGGLGPDFSATLTGVAGNGVLLSGHFPKSFGYTQFVDQFTAIGSQTTIAFAGAKLSSWFNVDDVVVVPLPENGPAPAWPNPSVTVSSSANPAPVGTAVTFTATLSPVPVCGAVSWLVDNTPAFADATPLPGNYVLGPLAGLSAGVHTVTAAFSGCPADDESSGTVIEQIGNSTQPGSPPSPTPSPTVSSSPSPTTPAKPAPKVSDPVIAATLSSAKPEHNGWYRKPVTVTFACTPGSSPMAGSCPAPVVLSSSGNNVSVTRSVTDIDGGTASVTATADIDRVGPELRVTPRTGSCKTRDTLSGAGPCEVNEFNTTRHGITTVHWIARGYDRAGNVTKGSGEHRL